MDRLIDDCGSIEELNELIGRGLDEYHCQMAVNRIFELVTEGESIDDDGVNVPTTSTARNTTGTTITAEEISSTEDVDRLNAIIDGDDWETEISGLAFQRILELGGIEVDTLSVITSTSENQSVSDNVEYSTENLIGDLQLPVTENLMEYMIGGDDPVQIAENVSNQT
jgi:hypothetical protein